MRNAKLILMLSLVTLVVLGSVELAGAQSAIILVDRTGSMNVEFPSTDKWRCVAAVDTALVDVLLFFTAHPAGSAAVWTFTDGSWIDRTGGFVGQMACIDAVVSLYDESCDGGTPLAESMCAAADELFLRSEPRILYVSSDGGENQSSGECAGDSALVLPYPPDTWQGKVIAKLKATGTVNVRYWGALEKSGGIYDMETGETHMPGISDAQFFRDLAHQTGGSYVNMEHRGPPPGVPSLSQWGVLVLLVLLLVSGGMIMYRKRSVPSNPA